MTERIIGEVEYGGKSPDTNDCQVVYVRDGDVFVRTYEHDAGGSWAITTARMNDRGAALIELLMRAWGSTL